MLGWLFRPQCAACGTAGSAGEPLCPACRESLAPNAAACPRCAQPNAEAACRRCAHEPLPLAAVVAPWRFGGELASAIRRLKFTGAIHVARTLAPLWSPVLAAALAEHPGAPIVPVPLHWRRRWHRGFDHTWLLAVHACAHAGLPPPLPALRRTRHAAAQSTLPAAQRAANVRGAFTARAPLAGPVILVDDVVTTGATLAAAARALTRAGAATVIGIAIARAE